MACPECEGGGIIWRPDDEVDGEIVWVRRQCPQCGGTGGVATD